MHTTSARPAPEAGPCGDVTAPARVSGPHGHGRPGAMPRHAARRASPALCARVRAVGRHEAEHLRRFLDARAARRRRGHAAGVGGARDRPLRPRRRPRVRGAPRAARRARARGRRRAEPGPDLRAPDPHLPGRVDGRARQRHRHARARDLHRRPAGVGAPAPPRGRVARRRLGGRPGGPPGAGLGGGRGDAALRGARAAAPTRRPSSTGRSPSSRSAAAPWSS